MIIAIAPKDINTKYHWFETFGRMKREISARMLVKFCQHKNPNAWPDDLSISKTELDKWADEDFWFNGLDDDSKGKPFILIDGDKVTLTSEFIALCYSKNKKYEKNNYRNNVGVIDGM